MTDQPKWMPSRETLLRVVYGRDPMKPETTFGQDTMAVGDVIRAAVETALSERPKLHTVNCDWMADELNRLATRIVELKAENEKALACVKAADAYVEAVVRIENSPGMQSVYTVASAHGCPYIGGNWSGELAQYRAARAEVDK